MPTRTEVSEMLFDLQEEDYRAVAKYIILLTGFEKETQALNDPFYSEKNQAAIRKADEQVKNGRVVIKSMEELEKMADE